jgi:hypothetical protein
MTKLFEIMNNEAGKPQTLVEGFGDISLLLNEKERYFKN